MKSCARDIEFALEFAFGSQRPYEVPVLMTITCTNYYNPKAIAFNNEAFTAYPCESEYLLMPGCDVIILAVEVDFEITNST